MVGSSGVGQKVCIHYCYYRNTWKLGKILWCRFIFHYNIMCEILGPLGIFEQRMLVLILVIVLKLVANLVFLL